MNSKQTINGNLPIGSVMNGHGREGPTSSRLLVEEAIEISLADLRQLFGRKAMLEAARNAQPLRFQIHNNPFQVYLISVPHRLPSRRLGASDREGIRLWLICTDCRRKARKLFTHPKFPGSSTLIFPACRQCLQLAYQSQNCGSNRWYREIARPLKKLIRKRERLIAKIPTEKVQAQLEEVDRFIWIMRQRANKKRRKRISQSTGIKRPYRDLNPILQSLPC